MTARTADYVDAIGHLPDGATLVVHRLTWDEYEDLLKDLLERPHLRIAYDHGKLEVMSPSTEHEEYALFIDYLVRIFSEVRGLTLEARGSATWKRKKLDRGIEPDACYYVANARRIIGKRKIDLATDPPPDIAVEIDIASDSLDKFSIYAAIGVTELWRYDGATAYFYGLQADGYREIPESRFLVGLTPALLAGALEQSKTEGQTAALEAFRQRILIR
jgi:Uma2 family endonuclease